MKTNFNGRPVNHRLSERIRAHFLICYTALLVYRLLEVRLDDQKTHVTPNDLITTLKNMNVTNVHDIEYMALYKGSKALDALTQLTMLPLDRCHYRPKDLNKLIKKFLNSKNIQHFQTQEKAGISLFFKGFRLYHSSKVLKTGYYTIKEP